MRGAIPEFGPRLKELRESLGFSQARLAEAAGTVGDSIVKFEAGKRLPTLELAWRIATALGVTLNDLVPSRRHPRVAPPLARARIEPKATG